MATNISFGTPVDTMGPYYSEADLNDQPVSNESIIILEKLIQEADGGLACELKEDGFRCQVHVNGKNLKLFTRGSGEFEVQCFPEVVEALHVLKLNKTILDGELRGSASGYDGFKAMQSRARYKGRINEKTLKAYLQTKPQEFPLQLVVFDVLMSKGRSQINKSNRTRRAMLEDMLEQNKTIFPAYRESAGNPQEVVSLYNQKVKGENQEGLVLKQPDLRYIPGDKTHWVKLKRFESLDLVILGLSKGETKEAAYGQALVGSYHQDKNAYQSLGYVNLVRKNPATGNLFADDVLRMTGKRLASPPDNVEVGAKKPEVYVRPSVVVEVRAMNIDRGSDFACSVDGKTFYSLRIAHVKCVREDKTAAQATTTAFVADYYKMQR